MPLTSALSALAESITEDRPPKVRDYFRFSSLGHCPVKQLAERAGMTPFSKPQRQAVFKMWVGKVLHEEAQKHLVKSGFISAESVEKEVRLGSYYGKIDGLTNNLPGGSLTVLEFKTAADDAITKKDWPEHYRWQGLAYAMAVGASKCLFVQLGTNYGLGRENVVMVSQEWQRKITRHVQLMDKLWAVYEKTKKLPRFHYHRFSWEDKYCPFIGLGDVPQRSKKEAYKPYLEPQPGEKGLGED